MFGKVVFKNEELFCKTSLNEIFRDKSFADVKLVAIDGNYVEAHKIILSCTSPVLRKVLESDNANKSEVKIDYSIDIVQLMLEFIYTGTVQLKFSHINGFIELAKFLQIKYGPQSETHKTSDISKSESSKEPETNVVDLKNRSRLAQICDQQSQLNFKLQNKTINEMSEDTTSSIQTMQILDSSMKQNVDKEISPFQDKEKNENGRKIITEHLRLEKLASVQPSDLKYIELAPKDTVFSTDSEFVIINFTKDGPKYVTESDFKNSIDSHMHKSSIAKGNRGLWLCKFCSYSTTDKFKLRHHIELHLDYYKVFCKQCTRKIRFIRRNSHLSRCDGTIQPIPPDRKPKPKYVPPELESLSPLPFTSKKRQFLIYVIKEGQLVTISHNQFESCVKSFIDRKSKAEFQCKSCNFLSKGYSHVFDHVEGIHRNQMPDYKFVCRYCKKQSNRHYGIVKHFHVCVMANQSHSKLEDTTALTSSIAIKVDMTN